jgi:delta24(24(1))-sterol reductase
MTDSASITFDIDKTDAPYSKYASINTPLGRSTSRSKLTSLDESLDKEIIYEFGGPLGTCAMMLGFPLLMYYFWISLEYHQGKLFYPTTLLSFGAWQDFLLHDIWDQIKLGARPTWTAILIYGGYTLLSFVLAYVMPGPTVEGLPIPSLKGERVSVYGYAVVTMVGSTRPESTNRCFLLL